MPIDILGSVIIVDKETGRESETIAINARLLKDDIKEVIFQSFPLERNKVVAIIAGIHGTFNIKSLKKEITI